MSRQPVVVGHRGWPNRYPANTIVGLLAATAVTEWVEIDVRRSGDGKLVLCHDPTMGGHLVSETPWSVLSVLDLGDGHKPALLDEALAALPDKSVQIEVKNIPGEPGYEPDHRLALEVAERARPQDVVTGFNWKTQSVVRRTYPDVTTGLAIDISIPMEVAVKHCLDTGHRVLVPEFSLVTEPIQTEVDIYPFTVNDPAKAVELVELGVTGIITDDPKLISQSLWGDQ